MNAFNFNPKLDLARKIKITGWFRLNEKDMAIIDNYNKGILDKIYIDGYYYEISLLMNNDGPLYQLELTRCKN